MKEPAMVAALAISGLIMRNAKEPAANVVLSTTGGQMVLQAEEGILNDILRFVTGKSEADKVSQQRFAQFAIQSGNLRGAVREAQEGKPQGYGICPHKIAASLAIQTTS